MNKLEFIQKLDAGSERVSDSTADLWFHLLTWVVQQGYADTADTPAFIAYVQKFRRVGVPTIGRHLARMAGAGFLVSHELRRKLPELAKADLNEDVYATLFGGGVSSMPTNFKRYTLPGVECPLELKSLDRLQERGREFALQMGTA